MDRSKMKQGSAPAGAAAAGTPQRVTRVLSAATSSKVLGDDHARTSFYKGYRTAADTTCNFSSARRDGTMLKFLVAIASLAIVGVQAGSSEIWPAADVLQRRSRLEMLFPNAVQYRFHVTKRLLYSPLLIPAAGSWHLSVHARARRTSTRTHAPPPAHTPARGHAPSCTRSTARVSCLVDQRPRLSDFLSVAERDWLPLSIVLRSATSRSRSSRGGSLCQTRCRQ